MRPLPPSTRRTPSSLLVTLMLLGSAGSAMAQVSAMQATGQYNLDAGGLTGNNTDTYPPNSYVDVLNFPGTGTSQAGYHSYGATDGNFGSRSSGSGVYDVSSAFHITQTVTNTSSTVQSAIFNFHISPGMLMNLPTSMSGAEFIKSGIRFDIRRDSATIWDSQAELSTNASGSAFNFSGNDLYTLVSPTNYSIAGGAFSVNLGALNPGQSLTLDYDLSTWASGNAPGGPSVTVPGYTYTVPGQWVECRPPVVAAAARVVVDNGPCEPTYVPEHTVTVPDQVLPSGTPGGSHASAGDPFDIAWDGTPYYIGNSPASQTISTISLMEVPEPSTYALMGLGLLCIGLRLGRRTAV